MFHRLYPVPFTRINESWNPLGKVNSAPSEPYCDPMITGKANHFRDGETYCEFYDNIAVDIVTETVYNYPHAQVTEKVLRPILQKRMFILVGPQDSLKLLKHQGFQTFDPWICEEYDRIADPFDRMHTVLAEIDRITNLPLDTLQGYMLECNDIIEHNRAHLIKECQEVPTRLAKMLEEM